MSIEGFYQIAWENTEIDPPGTYFSTFDFIGNGGDTLCLALKARPAQGFQERTATHGTTGSLASTSMPLRLP